MGSCWQRTLCERDEEREEEEHDDRNGNLTPGS